MVMVAVALACPISVLVWDRDADACAWLLPVVWRTPGTVSVGLTGSMPTWPMAVEFADNALAPAAAACIGTRACAGGCVHRRGDGLVAIQDGLRGQRSLAALTGITGGDHHAAAVISL